MDKAEDVHFFKKLELKNVNVLMSFSGWPDAKRVATYAAEYVKDKLSTEKIAEIDSKPFYDFAIQRPLVDIKQGLMKEYSPPINEIYAYKSKKTENDMLILMGIEPHTNWARYVESLFKELALEKSNIICLLGGLMDAIPHTIAPLISGVATVPKIVEDMRIRGIEPADYNGPSSIHSLILHECEKRSIQAFSVWGHSPEYVGEVDPRTSYHLLNKVKALMSIEIDLKELEMEGNLFQKQLDALMKQDQAFSSLVHKLELEYKNAKRNPEYLT
jgi:proteasome assembly chaperone (PAC2) family protein